MIVGSLTEPLRLAAAAALAAGAVMTWAVLFHGPAQFRAGAADAEIRLNAASEKAAKEISDEADRFRYNRARCRELDRLFDFATGECQR